MRFNFLSLVIAQLHSTEGMEIIVTESRAGNLPNFKKLQLFKISKKMTIIFFQNNLDFFPKKPWFFG